MLPLSDAQCQDVQSQPGVLAGNDVDKEIAQLGSGGVAIENYDMPSDKSPSGAIAAAAPKPPGSRTPKATYSRWSRVSNDVRLATILMSSH